MSDKVNIRLTRLQKSALLEWVAEGLETDEINRRAGDFTDSFAVSRQQVDYYRRTRGTSFAEKKSKGDDSALTKGFAVREKRIEALNNLATILLTELTEQKKLWLKNRKSIGSGLFAEVITYRTFNESEVRQFRGLLDDLAKEMGERATNVNVGGQNYNPLEIVQTQILKLYGEDDEQSLLEADENALDK